LTPFATVASFLFTSIFSLHTLEADLSFLVKKRILMSFSSLALKKEREKDTFLDCFDKPYRNQHRSTVYIIFWKFLSCRKGIVVPIEDSSSFVLLCTFD